MNVLTVVSQVVAIPIIFIPVALIWYINTGSMISAFKEARKRRTHKAA